MRQRDTLYGEALPALQFVSKLARAANPVHDDGCTYSGAAIGRNNGNTEHKGLPGYACVRAEHNKPSGQGAFDPPYCFE